MNVNNSLITEGVRVKPLGVSLNGGLDSEPSSSSFFTIFHLYKRGICNINRGR